MKEIEQLIKKHGGKEEVAELLEISYRYVNMLLKGKKPGRQLAKIIRMYAPR
jgi:predicted transcriptional regulator